MDMMQCTARRLVTDVCSTLDAAGAGGRVYDVREMLKQPHKPHPATCI
jgi:hypothetical protein